MSNADVDYTDIGGRAAKYIHQFEEHGEKAEILYSDLNEVFQRVTANAKKSLSLNAGLRDMSEVAKALSSIRGDAINSTTRAFDSLMKVADHQLKKEKTESEGEELQSHTILMRQLTESIQKQNFDSGRNNSNLTLDPGSSMADEEALNKRIKGDLKNGKINLNTNEISMKYDFNGVSYRFDAETESMVVLDPNGNPIKNYPLERIPEAFRFKKYANGIPVDGRGNEIKPYSGK